MSSPASTTAIADNPSRRGRRVREMHDRILAAAMALFEARGVEAVKIDDICAAADIAQKTFFNHFPTKQHLVREIAEDFLQQLLAILADVRAAGGTTAQQLERFFARIATDVERGGQVQRSFVVEVIRLAHEQGPDPEKSRRLYDAFGAMLREGVRAGDTTTEFPVAVLSEIVVGSFTTLMLNWLGFDHYPFRARATAMARFLGDALRPRKGLAAARRTAPRPRR